MSRFFSFLLNLVDYILSIVFQSECFFCGKKFIAKTFCESCFYLDKATTAISPSKDSSLDHIYFLFWLNEKALKIFYKIKYQHEKEWLCFFKEKAKDSIIEFDLQNYEVIIPVPIHWLKRWRRGFNQSKIIADWFSTWLSIPISVHTLKKVKETPPQSTLSRRERSKNLKRVFKWKGKKIPRSVLLIDDIITTGHTLEACAKTLKKAGVENVGALTLFRTAI